MIIETEGDMLTNVKQGSILCHQVNCQGVAGAGIAAQIKDKFPGWYESYKQYCDTFEHKIDLMGTIHAYNAAPGVIICSIFGQLSYGKDKVQTDYDALEMALKKIERETAIKNMNDGTGWTVHVPYMMSCGLAGGKWQIVRDMLEYIFGNSPVKLYIHKLPGAR